MALKMPSRFFVLVRYEVGRATACLLLGSLECYVYSQTSSLYGYARASPARVITRRAAFGETDGWAADPAP
jgi:hypothetical protein